MTLFGRKKTPVLIHIRAQVEWTTYRDPASNRWIAACDPLSITVSAETQDELREAIVDAQQFLLTDLFEEGELEAFLLSNGWRPAQPLPAPAKTIPQFHLPFEMQRANSAEELISA